MGNKEIKKGSKIRSSVFTLVSFLVFSLSIYKLATFGFVMSELSSLSLDLFPIFWYIVAVLSFLFVNFPTYLRMIQKVNRVEDLARRLRMNLLDVFKSERDMNTFEKSQIVPFVMLLFASTLFPFVIMTLSGLIFSNYNSEFLYKSASILSIYFILIMSIYYYKMTLMSALLERCKPFIQYANRNLTRK